MNYSHVQTTRRGLPAGSWPDDQTGIALLATGIVTTLVESGSFPIWEMGPVWIQVRTPMMDNQPSYFVLVQPPPGIAWKEIPAIIKAAIWAELRDLQTREPLDTGNCFRGGFLLIVASQGGEYVVTAEITHSDQSQETRLFRLRINDRWRLELVGGGTGPQRGEDR